MRKALLSLLAIILYISSCNYHKVMFDITLRANYIISLMEEYNKINGHYPEKSGDILEIEIELDWDCMMHNSSKILGNGCFLIHNQGINRDIYGNILVVGGYNPPNVIYFPKIKRKEINSNYFSDFFTPRN